MSPPETYTLAGSIKVVERVFSLPLDYSDPLGKKLRVFARNLISTQRARTPEEQGNSPICFTSRACLFAWMVSRSR
ncbi:hypothetical protein FB451DRAFT_1568367 [Mycena latifolia]|nr:hypothetical protein FB451DRAFT_1568367 [Mycena latifolia]